MKKAFWTGAAVVLSLPAGAWAIPNYSRLYKSQYGYAPHCSLCHRLQDWEMTDFGKEFSRQGRTLAGLRALEGKDSDGDGVKDLEEIQKSSNAGDPYSTPQRPGPWLKEAKIRPPVKPLTKSFPGNSGIDVLEVDWTPEQLKALQAAGEGTLSDEARYPIVFLVKDGQGKPMGAATYVSYDIPGKDFSTNVLLVLADSRGAVVKIEFPLHRGDGQIKKPEFLNQYAGKTLEALKAAPLAPSGAEADARAFQAALRRALLVLTEAQK